MHNRTIYCHDTTLFSSRTRRQRLASLMLTSVTFKYSALTLAAKPTQSDEIYVLTKKHIPHCEGGREGSKLPPHTLKGLTKLTKNSKSQAEDTTGRVRLCLHVQSLPDLVCRTAAISALGFCFFFFRVWVSFLVAPGLLPSCALLAYV